MTSEEVCLQRASTVLMQIIVYTTQGWKMYIESQQNLEGFGTFVVQFYPSPGRAFSKANISKH